MAVASLVTGIAQGYNGTYTSTDTFSATPETLYANKAGMAIGTLLSLRNPVKTVKQLGTEALQAGTLNTVTKGASSQFSKVERWFCKTTTGPTSIKTLEKTSNIARVELATINAKFTKLGSNAQNIQRIDNYFQIENGMKVSQRYYNRLWASGRPAPFLQAREILQSSPKIFLDPKGMQGFMRYEACKMEMIYNPYTQEIWHLQPLR